MQVSEDKFNAIANVLLPKYWVPCKRYGTSCVTHSTYYTVVSYINQSSARCSLVELTDSHVRRIIAILGEVE